MCRRRVAGKFGINIEIKSAIPLVVVESPSHGDAFAVAQHTPSISRRRSKPAAAAWRAMSWWRFTRRGRARGWT
jgi:hypothetical protein